MIPDDVSDRAHELRECAKLDGTENGEWWRALTSLEDAIDYGASDRFKKAWIAEINSEYKRLTKNFRVTETVKDVKQIIRRLDYIG